MTHYLKYILTSTLFLGGLVLFYSCKNEDVAEPGGVKITFQSRSELKNNAGTIQVQEAYIGIGEIDFKPVNEPDSFGIEKRVYEGPYVVNLLTRAIRPAIRWIFVETGRYREIEVTTRSVLPGGSSIHIKGMILSSDGSGQIPFELVTAKEGVLTIKNSKGIDIRKGEDVDLMVYFDLSHLFENIPLDAAKESTEEVLMISDESEEEIIDLIIDRIERFSGFYLNEGTFPDDLFDDGTDKDSPGDEGDFNDDAGQEETGNPDAGDGQIEDSGDEDDQATEEDNSGSDSDTGDDDDTGATDQEEDGGASSPDEEGNKENDNDNQDSQDEESTDDDNGQEESSDNAGGEDTEPDDENDKNSGKGNSDDKGNKDKDKSDDKGNSGGKGKSDDKGKPGS